MFRKLAINFWKFFLSGNGMTIRTGRYFGRAAALGAIVGLVTVAFHRIIEFGHEFIAPAEQKYQEVLNTLRIEQYELRYY